MIHRKYFSLEIGRYDLVDISMMPIESCRSWFTKHLAVISCELAHVIFIIVTRN